MFCKKTLFLAGLTLCISFGGFCQIVTSAQNGLWSDPSTWVDGIVPTMFNSTAVAVNHAVQLDGNISVYAVSVSGLLTIEPGAVLDIVPLNGSGTLSVDPAGMVSVAGTIIGRDSVTYTSSSATLKFESGSTFHFLGASKAFIPLAEWNTDSNFIIAGFVGSGYINIAHSDSWKQRFGNVVYDCPLQTSFVDLNGYLKDIAGDLTIRNTNGQALRLSTTQKPLIRIDGDFIVEGFSEVWITTTSDSARVEIGKNFEYRSTSSGPSYFATRGKCHFSVAGDFIVDANGPLRFCSGSADSTGVRKTRLVLHRGLAIPRGSFIAPSPGKGMLVFDGTEDQEVNTDASDYNGYFDFHIQPEARVDLRENVISNLSGNLYVKGHLKVGSSHVSGAIQTGGAGNIQTKGTRTYYPGSTIEYNGTATQYIGPGHPSNGEVNLICNNFSSVLLLQNTFVRNLQVNSGNLNMSGFAVGITGDMVISPVSALLNSSVTLSGANNQIISLNGSALDEMNIDKTENTVVSFVSELKIKKLLQVKSPNTIVVANGFLTLLSTGDSAGSTASVGPVPPGSVISGDVTVQRYMSGEGWLFRYISSPVSNASVAQLKDDFAVTGNFLDPSSGYGIRSGSTSLYYYNASDVGYYGWNGYPVGGYASDHILAPGVGYCAYVRGNSSPITWDVTGNLNQGKIDLPVSFNPNSVDFQGWNLVGNPYAATIDWSSETGWEKSQDISSVFAIRDNGEGRFHYSDGDIGDLTEPHIAAGQSFWIRATAEGPSLSVNETAKVLEDAEFFRAPGPKQLDYLQLKISGNGEEDLAFLRRRKGASREFDLTDAGKMSNDVLSFSFVTSDGVDVAITAMDSLSCSETFPLKMEIARNQNGSFVKKPFGDYTIELKQFGLFSYGDVFISDRFTHDTLALSTYHFSITEHPESYSSNRFALVVKSGKISSPILHYPEEICSDGILWVTLGEESSQAAYSIQLDEKILTVQPKDTITLASDFKKEKEICFYVLGQNICQQLVLDTVLITRRPEVSRPELLAVKSCEPGPATIEVVALPMETFHWYDDELLQNEIASTYGTFVTPSSQNTSTFYVLKEDEHQCKGKSLRIDISVAFPDSLTLTNHAGVLSSNIGEVNWYFGDEQIESSKDHITPYFHGIYSAVAERNGCRQEASVLYEPELSIEVFPIPFRDFVRITFNSHSEHGDLVLINSAGREMIRQRVTHIPFDINTSDLTSGVYFLSVRVGKEWKKFRVLKE